MRKSYYHLAILALLATASGVAMMSPPTNVKADTQDTLTVPRTRVAGEVTTEAELREAVEAAIARTTGDPTQASVITLKADISLDSPLVIQGKCVEIDGQGQTITGLGSGVLSITKGGYASLKNVTLVGAKEGVKYAIVNVAGQFDDTTASRLDIHDGTIIRHSKDLSDGSTGLADGPGVNVDKNINTIGGKYVNNPCILNMYGGEIRDNKTWENGGGVFTNHAIFNMYGGVIQYNYTIASNNYGCGSGLAMYGGVFNMYGGEIKNNTIRGTKGAGAVFGDDRYDNANERTTDGLGTPTVNIMGGSISNNHSNNMAGGVACEGNFNMTAGHIDNNTAVKAYGGIQVVRDAEMSAPITTFTMSGGTINNNTSEYTYGAGLVWSNDPKSANSLGRIDVNITGGEISHNTAVSYGGLFLYCTGNTIVKNLVCDGNQSRTYAGFSISGTGPTEVENITVINNKANSPSIATCSGLYLYEMSSLVFKDSLLSGNEVTGSLGGNYGGMYIKSKGDALVSGIICRNNKADTIGGAGISCSGTSMLMTNCLFEGNEAKVKGGASISLSRAVTDGPWGRISIEDTRFENNRATFYGGAIYLTTLATAQGDDTPINMTNCSFTGNEASQGAGVFATSGAVISIDNSHFEDNKTVNINTEPHLTNQGQGGAIYLSGAEWEDFNVNTGKTLMQTNRVLPTLSVQNTIFQDNTADHGAGIYTVYHKYLTVGANNVFTNNQPLLPYVGHILRDVDLDNDGEPEKVTYAKNVHDEANQYLRPRYQTLYNDGDINYFPNGHRLIYHQNTSETDPVMFAGGVYVADSAFPSVLTVGDTNFENAGYHFAYWSATPNGEEYAAPTYFPEGDVHLYAIWEKKEPCDKHPVVDCHCNCQCEGKETVIIKETHTETHTETKTEVPVYVDRVNEVHTNTNTNTTTSNTTTIPAYVDRLKETLVNTPVVSASPVSVTVPPVSVSVPVTTQAVTPVAPITLDRIRAAVATMPATPTTTVETPKVEVPETPDIKPSSKDKVELPATSTEEASRGGWRWGWLFLIPLFLILFLLREKLYSPVYGRLLDDDELRARGLVIDDQHDLIFVPEQRQEEGMANVISAPVNGVIHEIDMSARKIAFRTRLGKHIFMTINSRQDLTEQFNALHVGDKVKAHDVLFKLESVEGVQVFVHTYNKAYKLDVHGEDLQQLPNQKRIAHYRLFERKHEELKSAPTT